MTGMPYNNRLQRTALRAAAEPDRYVFTHREYDRGDWKR